MVETIRYEVAEGITTITLNRPDRLNAFMVAEMISDFLTSGGATPGKAWLSRFCDARKIPARSFALDNPQACRNIAD